MGFDMRCASIFQHPKIIEGCARDKAQAIALLFPAETMGGRLDRAGHATRNLPPAFQKAILIDISHNPA
jgi:hypothetical protein